MPPRQKSIASLLRTEEVTLSVDRRIKARPAGLSALLETGDLITVVGTNPDAVALSAGGWIDVGKAVIDFIDDFLDDDGGGDGGGGGDTVTVVVKGAKGRKVTVTIE